MIGAETIIVAAQDTDGRGWSVVERTEGQERVLSRHRVAEAACIAARNEALWASSGWLVKPRRGRPFVPQLVNLDERRALA